MYVTALQCLYDTWLFRPFYKVSDIVLFFFYRQQLYSNVTAVLSQLLSRQQTPGPAHQVPTRPGPPPDKPSEDTPDPEQEVCIKFMC